VVLRRNVKQGARVSLPYAAPRNSRTSRSILFVRRILRDCNMQLRTHQPYRSSSQLTPKSGPTAPIAKQKKFAAISAHSACRVGQRVTARLCSFFEGLDADFEGLDAE
jgi:hypothetical protein